MDKSALRCAFLFLLYLLVLSYLDFATARTIASKRRQQAPPSALPVLKPIWLAILLALFWCSVEK